ncbi:hypothetical protein BCV70DRAFT_87575 [Testicularia cyperi]|uniref:Uncharacterized protein n=1 Tax=Testicularia cyperi TaxID=1882483 RepID=A0A317XSB8_9BASI|nr:hypothetical protein BCV70DRAFT_87575 [Testicularia cyperi]
MLRPPDALETASQRRMLPAWRASVRAKSVEHTRPPQKRRILVSSPAILGLCGWRRSRIGSKLATSRERFPQFFRTKKGEKQAFGIVPLSDSTGTTGMRGSLNSITKSWRTFPNKTCPRAWEQRLRHNLLLCPAESPTVSPASVCPALSTMSYMLGGDHHL